ncbi:MAG TPA: hypothetical protein VF165_15160 [Nocardioidaceae bacterium]
MSADALGGLFILLGFVLAIAFLAVWAWGIIDAASRPQQQWAAAGQSKALWLGLIVGLGAVLGCGTLGWVGSLLYALIARPALKRAQSAPPVLPASGYQL